MRKSRRILALAVALVMTVGMLPTSAFAAEPEEPQQGHVHTAECYAETLVCGLDEHTHGDDCYTITEAPAPEEDNSESNEPAGSDDATEPEPAPDAGAEDSGDQGGETEADVDSGSESAEGGESESESNSDEGGSSSDSSASESSDSSSSEETSIADEPAPLAAEPTKELTCELEEHSHSEDCYELTLICDLEEDEEAKAPETNGGAAATEEPSEAVQAFLDAVAALPETVDEENAEEIESLLQEALEMFGQLTAEEQEREDVMNAQMKAVSLWEQLEGVKAETLAEGPAAKIGDVEYETLQEAIDAAPDMSETTITLMRNVTERVAIENKVLTLDLNGYTLTGESGYRAIVVEAGILTVANGTLVPSGSLKSERSISAKYGVTAFGGGCIYIAKGKLIVENCTFSGDAGQWVRYSANPYGYYDTDAYGSHIHAASGVGAVTISNSTFENSKSKFGAVYAANKLLTVSDSTFTNNGNGLQLDNKEGVFTVVNCSFNGGVKAINASGGSTMTLNVTDSNFSGFVGGPVINSNGMLNITGGSFVGNSVDSNGVVELGGGSLVMDGTKLENNTSGGAVKTSSAANVTMRNVVATGNTGTTSMSSGGSVLNANRIKGKTVILENIVATGNENTKEHGGAFYLGGSSNDANTVIEITNCKLTGNTAKNGGGAIYLNNKGATTITDTEISGNTANGAVKYPGGGIHVGSTAGTVTLAGTTHVYNNQTPYATVRHLTVGATADIALSSSNSKTDFTSEDAVQRATLVLENETSFTGEDGIQYNLTKSDAKGLHYSSSGKYYWPAGYYTVKVEPAEVYLNAPEGAHNDSEKRIILAADLADAVKQAQENGAQTIYVCGSVALNAEAAELLNNSGLTFARCEEHPNGSMFSVSGSVTLNGAHIDGKNYESNSALISVSSSGHLTIAGDTVIENGKNLNGNGGAISISQGSLTMKGGTITGNTAKRGGGIYAFSNINGSKLVFEGGTVSRNIGTSYGGGAFIGYIPSEFGVQGGRSVFTENTAYIGGGVFFDHSDHKVYRADFTNNTATRPIAGEYYAGGGIYIEQGTNVAMNNVFVSGNKTKYPSAPECALGICPTGEMHVLDCQGLLVVNNRGNDIGFSRITTGAATENAGLQVSKYALGGGQVQYLKKSLFGSSYNRGEPLAEEEYDKFLQVSKGGTLALNTEASEQTIRWAREMAETNGVIVTGNYADGCGSGIMTNGSLTIGTDRIDMDVNKTWVKANLQEMVEIAGNDAELPAQIIVNLVRVNKDGSYELVNSDTRPDAMVALNKENNWSYTWKDLDPLAEWSVAEASVEGWKLWKVDQSGNYTPAAGDSFALTELPTEGMKTTTPTQYGHMQIDWSKEGYVITGLVAGKDGVLVAQDGGAVENTEDAIVKKLDADQYYLWKKISSDEAATFSSRAKVRMAMAAVVSDGEEEYELVAVSGKIHQLIDLVPVTESKIKDELFGRVANVLKNKNGEVTGYIVAYERLDGKDIYIRWEFEKGGLICTAADTNWITVITNKDSDDFKAVSFTKKTDGLKETDQKFTFDVKVTVNTPVIGEGGEDITENTFVYYTVDSEPNLIHRVGKITGIGTYEFPVTIKAGEKVTIHGLQVGDEYTITERPGEYDTYIDGEPNVKRTVSGTIEAQNDEGDEQKEISFEFFNRLASLTVTKDWVGSDVYPNSIQVQLLRNGKKLGDPKTLSADSDWSATWNQLRYYDENGEKYQYTVEEKSVEGYAPTYGEAQWNGEKYQYTVKIANTRELGDLTINKKVEGLPGSIAVEKTYVFTVEAVGENLMKETANKTFGSVSFDENGKATVEIKVDGTNLQGSVTIQNLPTGSYKVTEQTEGVQQEYYTLVATGTQNAEVTQSGVSVSFTNTYDRDEKKENATLTIHKDLKDGDNNLSSDKTFRFRITGKTVYNEEITPIEVEVIGGGNSETIKLMKGSYEIEELEPAKAEVPGYTWQRVEWPNGSNKVNLTNATNVTFTAVNHYTRNTGSLIIEKALAENAPEAAKTKEYTFEVTGPNGYQKTVVITGAGKEVLENLPTGQYTVKEQDAGISGYSWKATVDGVETQEVTVEVKLDETAEATITNDYTPNRRPPEDPDEPDEPNEPNEPNTPDEPNEDIPDEETPLTPGPGPNPEVPTPDVPKTPEEVIELEEPEVPLANMPGEPETPEEEIPDEDVPMADVPKTGDDSNAQLWLALALASLCGIALVARKSDESAR